MLHATISPDVPLPDPIQPPVPPLDIPRPPDVEPQPVIDPPPTVPPPGTPPDPRALAML